MKRPCHCGRALYKVPLDKFDDSVPAEQKQCVFCWNALNDPDYQRLWGIKPDGEMGGKVDIQALPKKSGPCGAC